jgi:hypothetical protein
MSRLKQFRSMMCSSVQIWIDWFPSAAPISPIRSAFSYITIPAEHLEIGYI